MDRSRSMEFVSFGRELKIRIYHRVWSLFRSVEN